MSAARNEAHALRRCADEASAISRAADVALARAGEAAKAAKAAAKEAEEAAQEAELVVSKLPGGLHGEPSMLVSDVLSGWHGEAAECVVQACISVFNPHGLISLATSCKQAHPGGLRCRASSPPRRASGCRFAVPESGADHIGGRRC